MTCKKKYKKTPTEFSHLGGMSIWNVIFELLHMAYA